MKKVYVISEHLMFGYGLENLLRQKQVDITVVGYQTNSAQLIEQVKRLQPDTLVLYSHHPVNDGLKIATYLLDHNLDITVISLSVDTNKMYIHHIAQQEVESVEDLVQAIIDQNLIASHSSPSGPTSPEC